MSEIIALQLFGKNDSKFLVVRQYEALVFFAKSAYLFEWKKVISFFWDEFRSLISVIWSSGKL